MVKIEVNEGTTALEFQGECSEVSIEICFALKAAVNALRQIGKSDRSIRKAFEICMNPKDK